MRPSRTTMVVLVVLALIGAACGGSSGERLTAEGVEVVPSRDFILASTQRTEASSYRYEASMSMVMDVGLFRMELDGDEPMLFGSTDGERHEMRMDLGAMLEEMSDSMGGFGDMDLSDMGLDPDDLTMEIVVDGTVMYVHSPMFAMMPLGGLEAAATGWVRVDLSRIPGMSPSDLAAMTGQTGADPSEILSVLSGMTDDITEDGTENVRGIETTRMVVQISMADMLEAQGGGQADDLLNEMRNDPAARRLVDSMLAETMDVVVNIDGAGMIRRVSFDMDLTSVMSAAAADAGAGFGELEMSIGMEMDLFDYGESIVVIVPPAATDVTPQFAQLASLA